MECSPLIVSLVGNGDVRTEPFLWPQVITHLTASIATNSPADVGRVATNAEVSSVSDVRNWQANMSALMVRDDNGQSLGLVVNRVHGFEASGLTVARNGYPADGRTI